jgi:HK97 family phage major capsid protein
MAENNEGAAVATPSPSQAGPVHASPRQAAPGHASAQADGSEARNRPRAGEVEERTAAGLGVDGRRIRGVIPYGVESRDMGGWREVIESTAFRGTRLDELRVTIDHRGVPLGRYPQTLEVEDSDDGLRWALDPPRSRGDVVEAVERGDMRAGSWRMVVAKDRWEGDVRHVEAVDELLDVCIAGAEDPAYPAAHVELRTQDRGREAADMEDRQDLAGTDAGDAGSGTDAGTGTTTRAQAGGGSTATDGSPGGATTGTPAAGGGATTGSAGSAGSLRVEDRTATSEARVLSIDDEIVRLIRGTGRGEQRTLTTAISISPTETSTRLFDRLRSASVVLRSGVSVLAIENDSVSYPKLTADVNPAWYAEGATLTAGDPTLSSDTITPQKVAHLVELTNEVVADAEPSVLEVVRQHLITMLGLKIDIGLIEGNGTPPNPLGLANVAGVQNIDTLGANGATPTNLDPWADAINALEAVNASAQAILMHPRTLATLRKLKKTVTAGNSIEPLLAEPTEDLPLRIFGVPVYVSSQMSITETRGTSTDTSSSYVFDTSRVFVVRRQAETVETDASRLFNQDKTEVRAKARLNLYVPDGQAIARIRGIRNV